MTPDAPNPADAPRVVDISDEIADAVHGLEWACDETNWPGNPTAFASQINDARTKLYAIIATELAAAKAALLELDRLRPTGSPPSTGDPEVNARWIVDTAIEERNELQAALVVAERRIGALETSLRVANDLLPAPGTIGKLEVERDAARSECAVLREALMDAVDCEITTADGDVVAGLCASHRAEAQIALTNTAAAEKWQAEIRAKALEPILMAAVFGTPEPPADDMARNPSPETAWNWGYSAAMQEVSRLAAPVTPPGEVGT